VYSLREEELIAAATNEGFPSSPPVADYKHKYRRVERGRRRSGLPPSRQAIAAAQH